MYLVGVYMIQNVVFINGNRVFVEYTVHRNPKTRVPYYVILQAWDLDKDEEICGLKLERITKRIEDKLSLYAGN